MPTRQLIWKNILFFGITSAIAIIGLPIYAVKVGLKLQDWALFAFMAFVTMLCTTLGYHRLFAHKAFRAHPAVVFFNLFFGGAAFGGSALKWASQHRDHHKFTDTDLDPYDIKKGFWYAHMDWFLTWKSVINLENAKDLSSNRWIKHQHDHYVWWATTAGIVLPLYIGYLTGSFWGAFFLGVCGRFFVIHQSIFFINSACHMFGKPTYDASGSARDSAIMAFLTHGEGYHSYHHRFPSDYRNGVRWYHWDPTKWTVWLLDKCGLVTDLRRMSEAQIISARSEVEKEKILNHIENNRRHDFAEAHPKLTAAYEELKSRLKAWEERAILYKRNKLEKFQLRQAKKEFFATRRQWLVLVARYSDVPQVA